MIKNSIETTFKTRRVQNYWKGTYNWIIEGIVNTWDYQLMYTIWKEKGLIISPNVNLISNIGFGENAIHCKEIDSDLSNAKTLNILPLKHPTRVIYAKKSDVNYHDYYLNPNFERVSIYKQLKRNLKKRFPFLINLKS